MTIKPGIYMATKDAHWSIGGYKKLPIFKVTQVVNTYYGERVYYQYMNRSKDYYRYIESFLECEPVPVSELMQELL